MERWFLVGAIAALVILVFDNPLGQAILSNIIEPDLGLPAPAVGGNAGGGGPSGVKIVTSNPTGCASCSSTPVTTAAPASPATVVLAPSNSQQLGNRVQPPGSPAPKSTLNINQNFPLF